MENSPNKKEKRKMFKFLLKGLLLSGAVIIAMLIAITIPALLMHYLGDAIGFTITIVALWIFCGVMYALDKSSSKI